MMQQGIPPPLALPENYKTQICRNWTPPNYICPFGHHCWYAHGPAELRAARQGSYKTELCRNWKAPNYFCPYGANCRYAHGITELRYVQRGQSYKTIECQNDASGVCDYGERCHFIHKYNNFGQPSLLAASFQENLHNFGAAAAAGQNPPNQG